MLAYSYLFLSRGRFAAWRNSLGDGSFVHLVLIVDQKTVFLRFD
jgi:hypothetical protein